MKTLFTGDYFVYMCTTCVCVYSSCKKIMLTIADCPFLMLTSSYSTYKLVDDQYGFFNVRFYCRLSEQDDNLFRSAKPLTLFHFVPSIHSSNLKAVLRLDKQIVL